GQQRGQFVQLAVPPDEARWMRRQAVARSPAGRLPCFEQAERARSRDGVAAFLPLALDAELAVNLLRIPLDGRRGKVQVIGNGARGEIARQQPKDLLLAGSEWLDGGGVREMIHQPVVAFDCWAITIRSAGETTL